nr:MAG TPA: Head Tail Connector Protein [Bacteriophage sp.]
MTVSCVTRDEAKSYMRVDHDADDTLIDTLLEASTGLVETRLKRSIIGDVDAGAVASDISGVPADLRMGVCIVASFWYENRNATDDELRSRVLRQAVFDKYIDWGVPDGAEN